MRTIHPTFTLCVAQEIRHVSFRRCRMARRGGQRGSCVAAGLRALPGAVGRRRAPKRGRAPPRTGAPGRRGASVRAPGRGRAPLGTARHRGAGTPPSGHRGVKTQWG